MDSSKDIGLSQLDTHGAYEWHLPQDLGRTWSWTAEELIYGTQ